MNNHQTAALVAALIELAGLAVIWWFIWATTRK